MNSNGAKKKKYEEIKKYFPTLKSVYIDYLANKT